jgi:hypothetical protein
VKYVFFILLFLSSLSSWAKSKGPQCPPDMDGKRVAAHHFRLKSGEHFLVCSKPELIETDRPKHRFLTQYDAYLIKGSQVRRVLSGSLNTPVRFEQRKGEIFEINHLNLRDQYYPLYRDRIVCKGDGCRRREKTCVFSQFQLNPASPRDLEREKVIFAKGAAYVQEMTAADLTHMSVLALSGRQLAIDFFTRLEPQPILLGSQITFYQQMQSLVSQMRYEGCLKVLEDERSSSARAASSKSKSRMSLTQQK